ncbi:MAG: CHAT domain-containing protein, partial [Hormoscilla sp.]
DRSGVATTLHNIGTVYYDIGKRQQALDYYNQALPISRSVGDRSGVAITLSNIGGVYDKIGKQQQALDYYNQALPIQREVGARSGVAITLSNIGSVYSDIGKQQQALDYYNQALPISRSVGDRKGEARTLNNIGLVYSGIGKRQQALDYFNQALPILREVGDRKGEAHTLNNIGGVYDKIGKQQQALDFFNQALPIVREVGDRSGEATTLSNIAFLYRDTNIPDKAITNWESSIKITLEMRGGLQREKRKQFLQSGGRREPAVALVDILIGQNQPDLAFEWLNLATTFDLADYTRLKNAKVRNPEAQRLIDQWNQTYERIKLLYGRLEDNPSNQLSQQINDLWSENNKLAEDISRRFPEVAELFEIKRTDIAKLQANIPEGTVVIQPVLLTNIGNVPNNIAIFVLTANEPTQVTKVKIDPTEFDELLTQYRQQLENPLEDSHEFEDNQEQLYDYLIRPVEAQIQAASPKQLAIIATGKLRYIPFETLYNRETDQYLIEKYPISYRTRISAREKSSEKQAFSPGRLLALGNPVPSEPQHLPGAEEEARKINQIMAGKLLLGKDASLDAFKLETPQSQLLHLATHGCFQKGGCEDLDMEENTLLFADKQLNIRDAALLGLENVDLIALSACQTAMEADSNGEEIAGLAYLFERAGAGAVMASLWNAHDESTKEIMVEFYQHLKDGKMSKAEALQKAKLTQIHKNPFFWSPFILIGDGS